MSFAKPKKLRWRRLLSFATDIINKTPHRSDGMLTKVIKTLAVIDSFNTQMTKGGKSSAISSFFGDLDLVEVTNDQFVNLFYSTGLRDSFTITRIEVGDYCEIVKATRADIGTLYFVEWHWGRRPEPSADFYHTPGFNFEKALAVLWENFHGRIHLGITQGREGELKSTYSEIPEPKEYLFGKTREMLQEFKEQHLLYVRDHVPRTYLFCGKQGIGKTSFCLRLAALTGGRTLRIDACGMTEVGVRDLDFIVNGLCPNFLIVDDIDRAPDLTKSLPTLFSILSDFKRKHPNVTVAMTINDINQLDVALIRPERIDEIIELEPPDGEDRTDILKGYLEAFGVTGEVDIAKLSEATEGLTAAYLQEIALQLRYRPQEKVLKLVTRMNELTKAKAVEKESKPGDIWHRASTKA
ncbi:ATP-binding protein [Candidatus Pacearchaeota archaeon]|jgi:hypothetical protein|nr:ATP-binding protein [Candidatus Pacearchaeota archaeon]